MLNVLGIACLLHVNSCEYGTIIALLCIMQVQSLPSPRLCSIMPARYLPPSQALRRMFVRKVVMLYYVRSQTQRNAATGASDLTNKSKAGERLIERLRTNRKKALVLQYTVISSQLDSSIIIYRIKLEIVLSSVELYGESNKLISKRIEVVLQP